MAHKVVNDKVVVDWTTGDPEGDRIVLLSAYRDFIEEIKGIAEKAHEGLGDEIMGVFKKWNVSTDNQVDEVPRIWIKRPE